MSAYCILLKSRAARFRYYSVISFTPTIALGARYMRATSTAFLENMLPSFLIYYKVPPDYDASSPSKVIQEFLSTS